MHVWGSPLHAFDRSLLTGGRILVRRAREGETLRTLDGTLRELRASDLLITDGERPVALAAIMGGLESEVSESTTELLLEAANFEPIGVLRTSERLGLRTEGSNKWEKGVDPYAAEPAAALASRLLVDLAAAEPIAAVDVNDGLPERPRITLRTDRASRLIGFDLATDEQRSILERLGFEVDRAWAVTVPTWRARDVTREVDLVEEVARVVLDQVPHTMPLRRLVAGHLTGEQRFRRALEDVLVGAGFTEAYTWSLTATDPDPAALRLPDPMSSDQAVLRTTLLHGLVEVAQVNVDAGNDAIRLFELARVYLPSGEQLPDERWHVGGIAEGGFDAARAAVQTIHEAFHLPLEVRRTTAPHLHPGKAAETDAGWLGELHPMLLEGSWGVFELDVARLMAPLPGADPLRRRDHLPGGPPGHRDRRARGRRGRSDRRRRTRCRGRRVARGPHLRRLPRRTGRGGAEVRRAPPRVPGAGPHPHRRRGRDPPRAGSSRRSPSGSGPSCARLARGPCRRRTRRRPAWRRCPCRRASATPRRCRRCLPRRAPRSTSGPCRGSRRSRSSERSGT